MLSADGLICDQCRQPTHATRHGICPSCDPAFKADLEGTVERLASPKLAAENKRLRALNTELLVMLEHLSAKLYDGFVGCMECGCVAACGHAPDCRLAALIVKAKEVK